MSVKINIYSYDLPYGRLELFSRTFRQTVKLPAKDYKKVINKILNDEYRYSRPLTVDIADEDFDDLDGVGGAVGVWVEKVQ